MAESRQRPGIEPNEDQAVVVRRIAEMYLSGKGFRAIADWLMGREVPAPRGGRVWHASTVKRVLSSPVHAGLIANDGVFIEGAHYGERIYDPEVYYQILEQMKSRSRIPSATLGCPEAPLAQSAVCDECGSRLTIANIGGRYRAYFCGGRKLYGIRCGSRPYVRGDVLEPRIVREIESVATDPRTMDLARKEAARLAKECSSARDNEGQELRTELASIERQWIELGQALANNTISSEMITACDKDLQSRKRAVEARLEEIEASYDPSTAAAVVQRALDVLDDFPRLWEAMEPEERQSVFALLVESLRIGRADHAIRVKLKLRFLDEVIFDLPVYQNRSRGRSPVPPAVSLRQLAYLALRHDGLSDEQIARRWDVAPGTVREARDRALERLGVSEVDQAVTKMRQELVDWRHMLPLDGRFRKVKDSFSILSSAEVRLLKGMARGRTDKQMASQLALPVSTVAGWRQRIREKLQSATTQAAVARATSLGILGPHDPSPTMLLAAFRRLRSPQNADRLAPLGLRPPTDRQMDYLQALADGLNVDQAARRMRVSAHAGSQLRQRIWQLTGASSYTQALERITQLGLLRWPLDEEMCD